MDWIWNALNSLAAIGAVVVAWFAYRRTRVAKPHWEFLRVEPREELDMELFSVDRHPTLKRSYCAVLRQAGPGTAETIRTQIKRPDSSWTDVDPLPLASHELPRGSELRVKLCDGHVPGEYQVRVLYRCLPDTTKDRRPWECTATV